MAIPTHREDCTTRTWRTTCPDCKQTVYFLCCTCGSKVFFDTLGYPWPLHSNSCQPYLVRQMIIGGTPASSIRALLASDSRRLGIPIPKEIDELLISYGAGGKPIINSIPPDPTPIQIKGIIKKFNPINFFKRLNISDNEINRKIMGEFASQRYFEVIVQEKPNGGQRQISQWSFLIPGDNVENNGFRLGLEIWGDLEAKLIYEEDVFWVATFIDWR